MSIGPRGGVGVAASVALHGVAALLVLALFRHEPAPSRIEIALLGPHVVSKEKAVSAPVRRKTTASRETFSTPAPVSASNQPQAKTLENDPIPEVRSPAVTAVQPTVSELSNKIEKFPVPPSLSPAETEVQRVAEFSFGEASPGHGRGSGALAMLSPREGRGRSDALGEASRSGEGGDREMAVALPSGGGSLPEYDQFYKRVQQRIQEMLVYPPPARRRELAGTVLLEIVLQTDGWVGRISVLRSSSHQLLDDAAVESVKRAAPFSFLSALPVREIVVRLPVVFELR